jgi:hypothetical protein
MFTDWLKEHWIKVVATLILFGGIGYHPYSYYELVRWATCIAGCYTAYRFYQRKQVFWVWVFVVIAVLFNPIVPFYLARDTWQNLDLLTAFVFIIPMFFKLPQQEGNDIKTK